MNKKHLYYAIAFMVCTYLISCLYKLPASLLQPVFHSSLPITADKFSGTIWNGATPITKLKVNNGLINIGQLNWQLKPLCLFKLSACLNIKLSPNSDSLGDIYIDTYATVNLSKTLHLQNSDIDIDAGWLMEMNGLPISAVGRINFLATEIKLSKADYLPNITGELKWLKAGIDYPEEYELGNYSVLINTQEEKNKQINGILSSENGLVNTNGTIDISHDGKVSINIDLASNAQTPESFVSVLSLLGKPNKQGIYNISHQTFLSTIF